jgi:hypothetical protein
MHELLLLLGGWWRPLPLGVEGRGHARGRDGEGAGGGRTTGLSAYNPF